MGFDLKNLAEMETFLNDNVFLSGTDSPGVEDAEILEQIETQKFVPSNETHPNFFGWWWSLALFKAPARALWKPAAAPKGKPGPKGKPAKAEKKPVEEEEEVDLFGDDDEEETARIKEEQAKRKQESKKKEHDHRLVLKSTVVFDVKGYEMEFDFDALAKKIWAEINVPGLTWMDSYKILPIAFGMKKLQLNMLIEDSVSTDELFEMIQEKWDEDIQSIDIVSFNKA